MSLLISLAILDAQRVPRLKPRRWGVEEDEFLLANLGELSEADIAERLGRSRNAVHLRWSRDMGLDAPSARDGFYTAHRVSKLIGCDVHAVCKWLDAGWLRGRLLPFDRRTWIVVERDLKRFLIRPASWVLFHPERIADESKRRLVALAQERWGDEWLSCGQAAKMAGVGYADVNRLIRRGKIPGCVKWGNWYIPKSSLVKVDFAKGRGYGHELDWSDDGDAFLLLARAVGLSGPAIERLMGWPRCRSLHRLSYLFKTGEMAYVIEKNGLPVLARRDDCLLLTDWRREGPADWEHERRFPSVARAMHAFHSGAELRRRDLEIVRGVLWTWAAFFLGRNSRVAVKLQAANTRRGISEIDLRAMRDILSGMGIDPMDGVFIALANRRSEIEPLLTPPPTLNVFPDGLTSSPG